MVQNFILANLVTLDWVCMSPSKQGFVLA